ncbi:Uncharacterized protein PCOAH_00031730 [Plasmodium coatneyi]|uniref:KIR protein n=1 Tax=Plasmodium coatneyi TaxID=208452 RepID=A0A1B1E1G9_9APIC|nr:Uncharacterized protein PCOAH_00031730 [Plasmodium coatneyi]ANQ08873.1 Uncharacterized protein PCOAH_00031730 [Plasmodium coatneyi]
MEGVIPVLYSGWIYDMLDSGGTFVKSGDASETQLKSKLGTYINIQHYAATTISAWKLVSKIKETHPSDDIICSWFYYWLGNKVNVNGDHTRKVLSQTMQEFYEALKEVLRENECKCNPLTHHNSWENFSQEKIKFDHSQDYEPKQETLQKYYQSCDGDYYKQGGRETSPKVPSASEVKEQCRRWLVEGDISGDGPTTTRAYCTKFRDTYKTYCQQHSSEAGCDVSKAETKEVEAATLVVSTGSATAAPIVSSVLGIGALPAVAFLLYKYDLLPPVIRNTFGGKNGNNTRKKRSTTKHDFDTLTMDTSTTLYSTENSSTYGGSIADSTDDSTLYNDGRRRSGGRNRGNNNRRSTQQERQHRQQQKQRTNIKYHAT